MKKGIEEIIGKTVTGIVKKEGSKGLRSQVFILFSDNTYCEFYSADSEIKAANISVGGADDVRGLYEYGLPHYRGSIRSLTTICNRRALGILLII